MADLTETMSRTHTCTCDRCGEPGAVNPNVAPSVSLPRGWELLSFTPRNMTTVTMTFDLCPACLAKLRELETIFDRRRLDFLHGAPVDAAAVGTVGEWTGKASAFLEEVRRG